MLEYGGRTMVVAELKKTPLRKTGEGPGHLRDGTAVVVLQVRPKDHSELADFVGGLGEETLEQRFFGPVRPEMATAQLEECENPPDRLSLMVELAAEPGKIIGQGEYVRDGPAAPSAEVAFIVGEHFRERGVATLLLERLAEAASAVGIQSFHASVQSPNTPMLDVFRGSGYLVVERWVEGEILLSFAIGPSARHAMHTEGRGAPPSKP
jgi:RimJ/RimL family protein N-acetyltransferase